MLRRLRGACRTAASAEAGQSVAEFAMVLPLLLTAALGVVEVGYFLLDQHVVTRVSREGSNLISRDTSLLDAGTAIRDMGTRPVDLNTNARVIFSVIKKVATAGAVNYDKEVLYQRSAYGALGTATSKLTTQGTGAFGGAPDYVAINSDNDSRLRVTNLPANLVIRGGFLYVTEVFTTHELLTPFDNFGVPIPSTLYSIAYF
jgi:Flp pilus assembly protein TadG